MFKNKTVYTIYIIFDGNENLMLQYLAFVRVQVVFFGHPTYIKEFLLILRLNSYKVGIIFATYRIMRANWTCWAGPFHKSMPLPAQTKPKYNSTPITSK